MAVIEPETRLSARRSSSRFPPRSTWRNDCGVSRQLGCALATEAMIAIADMTGTRFCDSTGLRALALAHKQAAAHHTELRLVITPANVLHVLAITKLDTVLRIYRAWTPRRHQHCQGGA